MCTGVPTNKVHWYQCLVIYLEPACTLLFALANHLAITQNQLVMPKMQVLAQASTVIKPGLTRITIVGHAGQ